MSSLLKTLPALQLAAISSILHCQSYKIEKRKQKNSETKPRTPLEEQWKLNKQSKWSTSKLKTPRSAEKREEPNLNGGDTSRVAIGNNLLPQHNSAAANTQPKAKSEHKTPKIHSKIQNFHFQISKEH